MVMGDQNWPEVSITKFSIQGDSGGPFTVADSQSGAHTLVGAVSFGVGCARVGKQIHKYKNTNTNAQIGKHKYK